MLHSGPVVLICRCSDTAEDRYLRSGNDQLHDLLDKTLNKSQNISSSS